MHGDFLNVKTAMGLERFEVAKSRNLSCSKSAENWAASSLWVGVKVHGDFLNIKTAMGLERFEVGKSRNSYDVPFRS